jgi:PHD/YefM family antitoxin component YafN of YafNO toxin-antitoxin module
MNTMEMDKATPLSEYAKKVTKARPLVLTVRGKANYALLSVSDLDVESLSLSMNPRFIAMLERSRARTRLEGGLSTEGVCRRLGIRPPRPARNRKRPCRTGRSKTANRESP